MKEFCVDLKTAKALKEKGFPQNTYFYHVCSELDPESSVIVDRYEALKINQTPNNAFAAPTSEELLKHLPTEINGHILEMERYEDGKIEVDYWSWFYYENDREYLIQSKKIFEKLSNAFAHLWLDLKEKGYIKEEKNV